MLITCVNVPWYARCHMTILLFVKIWFLDDLTCSDEVDTDFILYVFVCLSVFLQVSHCLKNSELTTFHLQCFDAVGWVAGRELAWLSVWSKVQTSIQSSWCHNYSLSPAPVKSRLVLPFWYRLTRVVPEKGPLNGCVCVCALTLLVGHQGL